MKFDNKIYVKDNKTVNLLFVKFQDLTPCRPNGFTLVELAIVLVIVGLLIGMGAGLLGPLTKRAKLIETRNIVKEVYETINGYAASNKRLPADLTVISAKTMDSYRNNLQYYFATGLTTSDLCTTSGTYLTVNDIGAAKTDVAFIVFSQGENLCNQTGNISTSPFNIADTGVPTACIGGGGTFGYDDIVMYVDISTLRQQICNSFRIVTDSLPSGTEEMVYSDSNLQATDGTISYTWSVLSGSLPIGLTLQNRTSGTCGSSTCSLSNSCGCISGTPTVDGSFNFTVTVTDAEARVATKSLAITINPNDPRITTEFLTYGTVSQAYPSVTLSVTGGKSPYTWAAGSLPAGLSLNSGTGVISGTPTTEGTYSFTVTATDNGSRTASKTLSITINPVVSGAGGGGGGGGGGGSSPPTCSVSASPDVVQSGNTTTLNFSISNGPVYASFSPQNGTCTTFSGSTGGSCTTGSLSSKTTYVLSVSNANGSASCSSVVFVGQASYRIWNNTGARYDFNIDGSCRQVNNNNEISTGALRLNSGETIFRYSTSNGTCGGASQAQLTYNSAVYADSNNNGLVNFTGTDR